MSCTIIGSESQIWCVNSSWDGGVVHTILGHFDLDIDFWPHFLVYHVCCISSILQLTFLKCVLCLTNSFGGIRHVTVTFLVRYDLDWDFTHHFLDICTRDMTLDLLQNFVSAQYL